MKKNEEIISMCKQFFGKWSAFALVFGFSAIITSEALSAVDPSEESPKFYKPLVSVSYSSSERTCVDGTGRIKYFDSQGRLIQEETYSNCDDSTNEYSGKTKEIRTDYSNMSYVAGEINYGSQNYSYEYACEDGKCALSSAYSSLSNPPFDDYKINYTCDPESRKCTYSDYNMYKDNTCNEHIKNDSSDSYNCTVYACANNWCRATEMIAAKKLGDGSYQNWIYKCNNNNTNCSLDKILSSNGDDEWTQGTGILFGRAIRPADYPILSTADITAPVLNTIYLCSKYDKWGDCVECGDSNVLVTDVGVCTEPGRCRGEHFINPETGNCDRKEGCSDFANGACICDSEYYTKDGACVLATEGCGDYYKKGNSCVSDCGGDSLEKNGVCISASLGCGEGYKDMGGYCNRVRYSPAEAAAIVGDSNTNIVTLTFKK